MIAKISATENLGGALGYNFRKVEKEEASILLANGLYQNREGTYTMAEVLADMQALIPEKCRTKKTVFHCSLNPHPDDKLSDEQLIRIAGEYMSALGYGDQPYIVFKHSDIAREHIHIVSLRVDAMGRKINDSFEGRRSKRITDAIEKKYGLIPSTPSKVELLYSPDKVDAVKGNMKEQIEKTVRSVLKHYAFCSIGEMNAILYRYNLTAEEVKTEFRGKKYDGIVYIPTDSSGNRVGLPIHASDIGRGVGYAAVVSKMQKSKETVKTHAAELRKSILKVMRTSPVTEEEMRSRLSEEGLRVCIRKNENGRIYGITFIDDKEGIAANGSRLGKGYSANMFNEYFSNVDENKFLDESLYGKSEEKAVSPEQTQTLPEGDNIGDEIVENIIGDGFVTGNDDWKEAAWQRKLRRQSRIHLRRRRKT